MYMIQFLHGMTKRLNSNYSRGNFCGRLIILALTIPCSAIYCHEMLRFAIAAEQKLTLIEYALVWWWNGLCANLEMYKNDYETFHQYWQLK